jgi:flavin reductase (DIM6/NTAB) family NADH-FMN oxidoreductase RutF
MEVFLTHENIAQLEKLERAALINSITGFKSLSLIGTVDTQQQTNLAVFNSVVHLGANPALMGFIVRPDSVERHTLSNIEETRYFTINHVHKQIYEQAHQTAARYGKDVSEFEACGLTPVYLNEFNSPFVKESAIKIGLEFAERIDIALNGTILVIGKIMQLYFPENAWCLDGYVDIEKAGTIACSGLDSYHETHRLARLGYAKPDKETTRIQLTYRTSD